MGRTTEGRRERSEVALLRLVLPFFIMNEEELNKLAAEAAEALEEAWSIGESSIFCDESDWDSATTEEIAEKLKPFLLRAFNTTRFLCDGI